MTDGGHHRRWPWITAGVLVLLVVASAVVAHRLNDDVNEVSIDDAIADFGQSQQSPSLPGSVDSTPVTRASSAPADSSDDTAEAGPSSTAAFAGAGGFELPAAGVYQYAATGGESVDALGGANHAYPAVTAIIVRPAGCGVEVSWMPFEERREWWVVCPIDGGLVSTTYGSEHEWFNTSDTTTLTCATEAWLVPPADAPADALMATCTGDGLTETRTLTVVGPTTVDVGGERVDAVEVRIDMTTTGSTNGTSSRSLVLHAGTGLPLRWADDVANTTGTPIGDVRYTEAFTLELSSLEPRT